MNAEFGNQGIPFGAEEGIYMNSFGDLPNNTMYLNRAPMLKAPIEGVKSAVIDKREEVKAALATTSPLFAIGTAFSDTSGSTPVLLPTIVDDTLYDLTIRDTPLSSGVVPRVTNRGVYADWITKSANATAKWEGEQTTASPTTATYGRDAKKVKFMRIFGEMTGPMMVASPDQWKDMMTIEVADKMQAMKYLEEDTIINGDPTAADFDGGVTDIRAFEGFINQVTTNTEDKNDAEIVISDVRQGNVKIREAYGHPTVGVTDLSTFDVLKGEMQNLLRYPAPTANVAFGIESMTIDGLPVITDLFMPTTDNAREFHIWDTQTERNVQMRVLQEVTMTELAKTTDTTKYMVKAYETMLMIQEKWCHRIYDIS